jgi:hypothetical protein
MLAGRQYACSQPTALVLLLSPCAAGLAAVVWRPLGSTLIHVSQALAGYCKRGVLSMACCRLVGRHWACSPCTCARCSPCTPNVCVCVHTPGAPVAAVGIPRRLATGCCCVVPTASVFGVCAGALQGCLGRWWGGCGSAGDMAAASQGLGLVLVLTLVCVQEGSLECRCIKPMGQPAEAWLGEAVGCWSWHQA